MKKIFNRIIMIALAVSVLSCEEPDNVVYNVFDNVEHGAALRTVERVSMNYNIFDLDSKFEIIVEEQDQESGNLLSKVDVYVSYKDNTDDGADNNKAEVLLVSVPASAFTKDAGSGLPRTTISSTFAESLSALGLSDGQYNGGDDFNFRLDLVLTNGETYSADSSSETLNQSYFSSPFAYRAGILCIPSSPVTGDYQLSMHDSYGDGWNGASVRMTVDGVSTDFTIPTGSEGTATMTVPADASTLMFEFISGDYDSEVSFEIYGPNSGNIIGSFGPTPIAGELALNLCNE